MAIIKRWAWFLPIIFFSLWFWQFWQLLPFSAQKSLFISFLTGSATVLGALPFLFFTKSNQSPLFLGISGGMMAGAAVFSLLLPSSLLFLENPLPKLAVAMLAALFLGVFVMQKIDAITPHEHIENLSNKTPINVFLIIGALALHNLPEGLAVGVSDDAAITLGIALQNLPEGALLAGMLTAAGMPRSRAVFWALLSGWVEVAGALLGVVLNVFLESSGNLLLPTALAFAGSAMLWVFFHEMLPSFERFKSHWGFLIGVLAMAALVLFLD